jgi:hypothetical protein
MPKDAKVFDPLHKRTRKLGNSPRYRNISYNPQPGTVWIYFDAQEEGDVEWMINEVNDDKSVTMTKRTGEQVGYTTDWPIIELSKSRWRPADAGATTTYLWACPECSRHRPILMGDYVCIDCREGLDVDA